MGPELPSDPGHEIFPTPAVDHPRVGIESEDSDDSDAYDGYQMLAMDDGDVNDSEPRTESQPQPPQLEAEAITVPVDDDDDIDLTTAAVTHGDPNMPPIESSDIEIERQVWNEPRPQELQMELDKTRTEQILKAMSTISLPNITVPDWAKGVPEERWKLELLERINSRQQPAANSKPAGTEEAPQHSKTSAD
ncbi:uncharacterized protein [Drosophila pseudoobscura]|uniref:Male-enhanced antigen 1 n=1 Tax=Drosophila pseudoobscura pseudoobscura TaxID=46245 RepID=A0A6I8W1M3_DROPS|nr:uncharacterized protein LOC4817611 isoform X1 [Drosophila pseudoobscura]XP_033236619.1 uncharacterized protein LOC4817611 isoform X2 [Drosophila pseudoobscura]